MPEPDTEFVGFGPAAKYLGVERNTLSSYVSRSTGPRVHDKRIEGQYVLPVFLKSDLDQWNKNRPGQGARTDLLKPGKAPGAA